MDKDTANATLTELNEFEREMRAYHHHLDEITSKMIRQMTDQLRSCGSESGKITARIYYHSCDRDFTIVGWSIDEVDLLHFDVRHDHETEDGEFLLDKDILATTFSYGDLRIVWEKVMSNCGYIPR